MSETGDFYTKYNKMLKGELPWDGEYDETAEVITVFSRLPKCEQERITREYEERQKNSEQTLDK